MAGRRKDPTALSSRIPRPPVIVRMGEALVCQKCLVKWARAEFRGRCLCLRCERVEKDEWNRR